MMARRAFFLGFAVALLTAFGCSRGGAQLGCSDGGAAAADAVAMDCGGATDNTTEQVDVVMGGPAAGNTTLNGFNFDVTYAPSKLEFVPAANYTSPLFPSALVAVTLFNGEPGRVVVSIQEFGGIPPVDVGAGQHDVLSLSFRRVPGTTFGPTPLTLENAEATTASTTVSFASGLALSYQ